MNDISLLVLAAGASRRMGKIKALLPWGGKNLIFHQLQIALDINDKVGAVLGAHAKRVRETIHTLGVNYFINTNWDEGMGNSIAFGTRAILEMYPKTKGLLILTVDQPLINKTHLDKMLAGFKPQQKQIIISESDQGWQGVPVLFDAYYFDELQKLTGDQGAKSLTKKYSENIIPISGGNLLIDIDTPKAYDTLKRRVNLQ